MRATRIGLVLALLCSGPAAAQQPELWRDPSSGIEFVRIRPGCMQMGSDTPGSFMPGEQPSPPMANEKPRHEVCVDGFWLGRTEVTRAQWKQVMHGGAPETERPQQPATHVSRDDALAFVARLNAQGGKRFRLPTEAEWEYACRAGATEEPPQTLNDANVTLQHVAWYYETAAPIPWPRDAGSLAANAWGLYDMLGNALEWVEDAYLDNGYAQHAKRNPKVVTGNGHYVLRGGSYKSDWWNTRCGARLFGLPGERLGVAGLRIAREADNK